MAELWLVRDSARWLLTTLGFALWHLSWKCRVVKKGQLTKYGPSGWKNSLTMRQALSCLQNPDWWLKAPSFATSWQSRAGFRVLLSTVSRAHRTIATTSACLAQPMHDPWGSSLATLACSYWYFDSRYGLSWWPLWTEIAGLVSVAQSSYHLTRLHCSSLK